MLNEIFKKYRCDKGENKHFYHLLYEKDFESIRFEPLKILEIGVYKGSSLQSWLEYFPNAEIYVIDTFERISETDLNYILKNPRVKYLKHSSTDFLIKEKLFSWNVKFDIIIDDGLHTPLANLYTLQNIIPFLKENGTYYIEDIFPIHIMSEDDLNFKWIKIEENKKNWSLSKFLMLLEELQKYNNFTFDNRHLTKHQDSFIFKIKHSQTYAK
jgi:hypothetical protein